MKKLILFTVVVIVCWKLLGQPQQITLGPGVKAAEQPAQTKINSPDPFTYNNYTITPLAEFSIKAKVLAKKNYHYDRGSDISPVDLALGWGRMSDEAVLEHINIRQSSRWYRWDTAHYPIPRREIETSSANMHMIPANDLIESALDKINPGEIIHLQGKLVKVNSAKGYIWQSSLTRNDTGSGACELIWVEQLTKITD